MSVDIANIKEYYKNGRKKGLMERIRKKTILSLLEFFVFLLSFLIVYYYGKL